MRLLSKNISLTKKVGFTLSSKIIQAACLFLFSGSVRKLSFDRIIINETCHLFCFKTHRRAINFFVFILLVISQVNSFFECKSALLKKTNISFQLNAPLRRGEETYLEIF